MYVSFLPFAEFVKSVFENAIKPLEPREEDAEFLGKLEKQKGDKDNIVLQFGADELKIETKAVAFVEGKAPNEITLGKSQKNKKKLKNI